MKIEELENSVNSATMQANIYSIINLNLCKRGDNKKLKDEGKFMDFNKNTVNSFLNNTRNHYDYDYLFVCYNQQKR